MIKFKQKTFFWGNALMIGSTAIGMKQSADAKEQNEELAKKQEKDNEKLRQSIDNLANSGASPEVKQQAASLFSELKTFAAPSTGTNNSVLGFAKDLWEHSGSGVKKAVKMGAGFAAAGYLGNRIAASLKNHDEGRDDKTDNFIKKATLGAATVGGGLLAARKGLLGTGVKDFMTTGKGGKYLNTAKNVLMENVSPISRNVDKATGVSKVSFNPFNTLFIAAPSVMYIAQKRMQKNQMKNTQQESDQVPSKYSQRQYASWIDWTKNAVNHLKQNPKQAISGGFNKLGNFLGMMGGKGGTSAVQKGFKKLEDIGIRSGNKYTQALGRWGQNNPIAANWVTGGAALGIGGAAFGLGGKVINKPMKAFDKEAYQMEEQENDKI